MIYDVVVVADKKQIISTQFVRVCVITVSEIHIGGSVTGLWGAYDLS